MFRPIAFRQGGIGNRASGIRGVEELAVPGVNAHMGNGAAGGQPEEHQIAGYQGGLVHRRTHSILIGRGAVGSKTQLVQDIVHKSRTIKATGGTAPGSIGTADVFLSLRQNLGAGDTCGKGTGRTGNLLGLDRQISNGLTAPEILGRLGRCLIFIGDFGEF